MNDFVNPSLDMAKGITDFGALAIMGAMLLVFVGVILFFFLKMMTTLFNNFLKSIEKNIQRVIDILTGDDLSRIKVTIKYALQFIPHEVCVCIADIKERNGLSDEEEIKRNLRVILENLYKKFVSDINTFSYRENRLEYYCNPEWIDLIYEFCIKAIYDGKTYHRDLYLGKLNNLYRTIMNEFFENLDKKN